eukprot:5630733-Prymnesium_polylepis.1
MSSASPLLCGAFAAPVPPPASERRFSNNPSGSPAASGARSTLAKVPALYSDVCETGPEICRGLCGAGTHASQPRHSGITPCIDASQSTSSISGGAKPGMATGALGDPFASGKPAASGERSGAIWRSVAWCLLPTATCAKPEICRGLCGAGTHASLPRHSGITPCVDADGSPLSVSPTPP